jgi:photosystem II stability/assembly factor-like uncharacterized protein
MKTSLFAATAHGLLTFVREGDGWREDDQALPGHRFTCITGQDHAVLAGTRRGIYRSGDLGQTWWQANDGLSELHVRWLAFHPSDANLAFAGTEPAAIFVSRDGGQSWQECPEVASLRDALGWDLPYSPEAGCVRDLAFHELRGYAAVEQGGVLRTEDRGQTWGLVEGSTGRPHTRVPPGFIHPDVHSIVVHPSSQDQLYAPTGGGFYYSSDGGQTWALLYRCYCRAVWADPLRPGHVILGPADGVDRNGRIEESLDGGQSWQPVMAGLETHWPHHMVERFVQGGDDLVAVLSNGQLIAAPLATLAWQSLLPAEQDVTAVAVFQQA